MPCLEANKYYTMGSGGVGKQAGKARADQRVRFNMLNSCLNNRPWFE